MSLFWRIIEFLKETAPIFIVFNISVAIVLLILGLVLIAKKNREQKTKKFIGIGCLSVSLLSFLGALSNAFASFVVF
ncbi:hypothetical protein [Lysinibacillus sp. ZYM-1]|uniref:hypothetical protein n=1 Tax=Lysinibacillus sp. ZYM-1 TaxID=1681184 RepID=UPI0006CE77E1|nr:hypothetical protein [Lysinibacillus sp. ZYM-1]KPN96544.1 hypothetical protein AO843_16625 [Lysinibacillus sp. ZYM-1]